MMRKRTILIIVAIVLLFVYWTTDRMDPLLAPVGLNHSNCYQIFGSTVCGEDAERFEQLKKELAK